MMLIGNGVGHTGSKIVEGTIHEESGAVAVHNTYLQWAADFGLIGFALEAVFLGHCAASGFAWRSLRRNGSAVRWC